MTYDANTDTMTPAATVPDYATLKSAVPPTEAPAGLTNPNRGPNAEGLPKAQTWAAPAVVTDPHLSGDDPKMFPGVLSRGHRTSSLKSLQAEEAQAHPAAEK